MNADLAKSLRKVLASTFSMYLHAHDFHWNVVGPNFAQLHEFFQEIYEDVYGAVDTLAEDLRKLNFKAPFTLTHLASLSTVTESRPNKDTDMLSSLGVINQTVLDSLIECFGIANDANEQGIANFIAERIDMHQKWAWQIRSFKG